MCTLHCFGACAQDPAQVCGAAAVMNPRCGQLGGLKLAANFAGCKFEMCLLC